MLMRITPQTSKLSKEHGNIIFVKNRVAGVSRIRYSWSTNAKSGQRRRWKASNRSLQV